MAKEESCVIVAEVADRSDPLTVYQAAHRAVLTFAPRAADDAVIAVGRVLQESGSVQAGTVRQIILERDPVARALRAAPPK